MLCLLFQTGAETARAQTSAQMAEVRIRGDVRCIQPMGDGSFVLGGFTAYFNGARDGQLIRITSGGGRVAFPVTIGGSVSGMALAGGWLYLGGDFQTVNGVSLPFAARVDAITGAVDPTWRPAPNGDLLDIVPVAGGVVLNGSFSTVSGLPRNRLAMVSATGSGQAVETWHCDANNQVDRLVLIGPWLYAGGRYSRIGGLIISGLSRINPANGVVDGSWLPAPNSNVYDIASDGTNLYLAGDFSQVGGVLAPFLARLKPNSAQGDSAWAPKPDSLCARLCVSGDSVYVSGNFTSISNVPQSYLARVVRSTGSADPTWLPPFDGGVLALVSDGGNGCWGGGRFDSNGLGSGFAHFLNNQGSNAPTYPATIENLGAVKVIKPAPGLGGWLVGGNFDTVNGHKKNSLFHLASDRTLDTAWSAGLGGSYSEVNDMVFRGNDVIIGGQFEKPGLANQLLFNCLRLNLSNGATVQTFNPQPSDVIYSFYDEGSSWLIGGAFNLIGGYNIPYLARLGQDGTVSPLLQYAPNGPVRILAEDSGDLYLGGDFTGFTDGIVTTPVPYLARFSGGILDVAWQPKPNQSVFSIAINGGYLYAGGRFTDMGRQRRKYLAQIPLGGAGTPTAWNPAPDSEVTALRVDGTKMYVGGAFYAMAGYQWPKIARFDLTGPTLDTTFRSVGQNGEVLAILPQSANDVFVGGSFNSWDNDVNKRSLLQITGSSPPLIVVPPPGGGSELLADYFAPTVGSPLTPLPDYKLQWTENTVLPAGMVARVQWSANLNAWHESGETADGVHVLISIAADGPIRTAQILNDQPLPTVFLRIVVTGGGNPPSNTKL